jgi:hypothetical protein
VNRASHGLCVSQKKHTGIASLLSTLSTRLYEPGTSDWPDDVGERRRIVVVLFAERQTVLCWCCYTSTDIAMRWLRVYDVRNCAGGAHGLLEDADKVTGGFDVF